jgi:pimeloyl-ACP methyl ester carboxylesterase
MDTAPAYRPQPDSPAAPAQMEESAPLARYRAAERELWLRAVGALPAERYVRLPGIGARVRLLEHGRGPTLLFVHGGPSAASKWAPLVGQLAGFRCVLLDRPGCGLSERPARPPKGVRSYMTQLIDETIAALDEPPAAIVASSFGSFAALAFAAAHPERAPRMVHLGCPALIPGAQVPLPLLLPCLPVLGPLMRRLSPPTLELSRRAFRWMGHQEALVYGEALAPFFAWYTALTRDTPTRANDQNLFGGIRPADALSRGQLARLPAPASFFWGAADPFGGPDVARALAATMPNAALELLPQSGHLPWLDAPERAAAHVRAFVGA